jgi:hypothetical protein
MQQLEFEYFWPLTEQIPLDLDYSVCWKPSVVTPTINGGTGLMVSRDDTSITWSTTFVADDIDTKKLSIVLDKKPNFVVRWLYKLLKINWKV